MTSKMSFTRIEIHQTLCRLFVRPPVPIGKLTTPVNVLNTRILLINSGLNYMKYNFSLFFGLFRTSTISITASGARRDFVKGDVPVNQNNENVLYHKITKQSFMIDATTYTGRYVAILFI